MTRVEEPKPKETQGTSRDIDRKVQDLKQRVEQTVRLLKAYRLVDGIDCTKK